MRIAHMYFILSAALHFHEFPLRCIEVFPTNNFHRITLISQIVDIMHSSFSGRGSLLQSQSLGDTRNIQSVTLSTL